MEGLRDYQPSQTDPGSIAPRGIAPNLFPKSLTQTPGSNPLTLDSLREYLRGHLLFSKKMPWLDPDESSIPIDVVASLSLNASSGSFQTIATYTCSPSNYAVIKRYGHEVQGANAATFNSINWQITVNGISYQNYGSFTIQRGTIINPRETFIFVTQKGATINFNAQNTNTAAYTAIAGFSGWEFIGNQEPLNDYIQSLKNYLNY